MLCLSLSNRFIRYGYYQKSGKRYCFIPGQKIRLEEPLSLEKFCQVETIDFIGELLSEMIKANPIETENLACSIPFHFVNLSIDHIDSGLSQADIIEQLNWLSQARFGAAHQQYFIQHYPINNQIEFLSIAILQDLRTNLEQLAQKLQLHFKFLDVDIFSIYAALSQSLLKGQFTNSALLVQHDSFYALSTFNENNLSGFAQFRITGDKKLEFQSICGYELGQLGSELYLNDFFNREKLVLPAFSQLVLYRDVDCQNSDIETIRALYPDISIMADQLGDTLRRNFKISKSDSEFQITEVSELLGLITHQNSEEAT
jgi:hypothetical protein